MSLEKGESRSSEEGSEKFDVALKKPKFSYPREFLLSLSDLDICKKLPSGFDESLLSEFEGAAPQSIQDRPRIPGSYPLQGFRRNQYGSSPPTRGDSGNYSRATFGKWESRSSGRSDRDSDSQSDRDSDSGRRYGPPSRRSWQGTEQDGLLGSGSLQRPSGHVSGIHVSKVRANEDYQLSKSNEPYHPPRPYKAAPYSRRDTDAFNDETFGSVECDDEDRAQEERRRRASFELIRKEQQKVLQEKQKLNLEKNKSSVISNLSDVLEDKNEEMASTTWKKELDISPVATASSNNLDISSLAPQAPASRPLVPPGFSNGMLEKSSGLKCQAQPFVEEGKPATGESLLDPDRTGASLQKKLSQDANLVSGQSSKAPPLNAGQNVKPLNTSDLHSQLLNASSCVDSHVTLDETQIVGLNSDPLLDKPTREAGIKFSPSILEEIFGGALSVNDDVSNSAEHNHSKPDDTQSSNSIQSSKFAQWFFEEETKPADGIISGKPNELLSLIAGGNRDQCQVSDFETANILPDYSLEQSNKFTHELPQVTNSIPDQVGMNKKEESISTVITCEDLEQSILTEYNVKAASTKPLSETWSVTDSNNEQTNEHDNQGFMHLLSLLQKGADRNTMGVISTASQNLEDKSVVSLEHDRSMAVDDHKRDECGKNLPSSGQSITLEALFGSAFMQELQSADAPVSVRRSSNESNEVNARESHGLHFPVADNIVPSSAADINGLRGPSHSHRLASDKQKMRPNISEKWLGVADSGNGILSGNDHLEEVRKHDGFGPIEFQPPEMNINSEMDPLNHRMLAYMQTHNPVNNVDLSSHRPIEILDKLAAINAVNDGRVAVSENLPFPHPPYRNMDPRLAYPSPHAQPLPHFPPPQMAQLRPLPNNLEPDLTHMSSQVKFLGPEPRFNHYSSANHQFPSNMVQLPFHQPNIGISGLDGHSVGPVQHQIHLPGNRNHFLQEFPRSGNQAAAGFIQEPNQVQRFPLDPRKPNTINPGFPIPGVELNSGHNPPPEFFQKLIEMGMEAKSKHVHLGYEHGGFQHR